MPYCPKCDMEFVDGITVCSDCKEPLISVEEAALLREAEEKNAEQAQFEKELGIAKAQAQAQEKTTESELPKASAGTYVTKRQRHEDMKASISAFFLLGSIFFIFGVLCLLNIVKLPLAAGPMMLFKTVLTAMGIGCLIVAAVTRRSAARILTEAGEEEALTRKLTDWFTATYKGDEMDRFLLAEDPSLEEQELYLKRFELIQDYLITSHDLPDQSYVDYLCEEIYGKVFEH